MTLTWLVGLLRRRRGRLAAAAVGVAVSVALLASLGTFLAASKATMTARAVQNVTVDWQVQVQPTADLRTVTEAVRATPQASDVQPVNFGQTSGFTATTQGTLQHTGPGIVLGLPSGYASAFPGQVRALTGTGEGTLLAQQTASNLHAAAGDTVEIARAGLPTVTIRIDGVIDLPNADSLFQKVGAPAGAQPPAPPDNVLILPSGRWHQFFDPLAATRPDLVSTQLHVRLAHSLPSDPAAAYSAVLARAHNLEARTVGGGVVGDNLAAALGAARQDAAYAQVLFLFLGLPGAVLAALLTVAVASAGRERRRAEQALLRARGASADQLLELAALEAATVAIVGCVLGLLGAAAVGKVAFGSASFGTTASAGFGWAAAAALVGVAVAAGTVLLPARSDARSATVMSGRQSVGHLGGVRWTRYPLDLVLLVGAGVVFSVTSRSGYQLVLAPEGVPTISVSYWTFAGPALLWVGAGVLGWRLIDLLLGRGRRMVRWGLRPIAGNLSGTAASSMSRQRRNLARAVVLLGLALAFAASTATFNATYRQQAEADAQLTNGADITITAAAGSNVLANSDVQLKRISGVRAVEPLLHRFAYVGADLQDLYGIHPVTIRRATSLQDGYFQGGSAATLMDTLAARPDSILVSAETVKDFQLNQGDLLNLRLPDARTGQLTTVAFHYTGIVTEFPTAPKDSFFVTNADYVAAKVGGAPASTLLVDTGGRNVTSVAAQVRSTLGTEVTVTDIATTRRVVGSSLSAVDLAGLTKVELGFALALAVAAGGLVVALGLSERRRSFAIAAVLGATRPQLRSLIVSETAVLALGGLLTGSAIGWALSQMLVKVLSGVFDPPPSKMAVPWLYLASVGGAVVTALIAASAGMLTLTGRSTPAVLREL